MSAKMIDIGSYEGIPQKQSIPFLQLYNGIIDPKTGLANDSGLECPRCGYKIRKSTDSGEFEKYKNRECPACSLEKKLKEPEFEIYATVDLIGNHCKVCGKSPSVGIVSIFINWKHATHIIVPLCLEHFNKEGFIQGLFRSNN